MTTLIEITGIDTETFENRLYHREEVRQMLVGGLDPGHHIFDVKHRYGDTAISGINATECEQMKQLLEANPKPWFVRAELQKSHLYNFYKITEVKLYDQNGTEIEYTPKTEIGGDPDPPVSEQPEE